MRRQGTDASIISYGADLWKSLKAAETLASTGISAEVIDLRTLRPLDDETCLGSIARTHRALIVDDGWRSGGIAAEISAPDHGACVLRSGRARPARLRRGCADAYAKHLEQAALPQPEGIAEATTSMLSKNG